jgi:type VI secretion system protein ImpH
MVTKGGQSDTTLTDLLFNHPYSFDFFQAVRVMERIYPKRSPIGRNNNPSTEVVHFRSRISLEFPPSQIHEINRPKEENSRPDEMVVAFMGLVGPTGLLPTHYTELIMERIRYKDTALWEFIDLFNHRMVSLFYRAWEKYRFPVAYERGELDRFTEYLFDIIGIGTKGLYGRFSIPDQALLLYGGLIAQRPHSASAMGAILSDFFDAPANIEQFSGQWLEVDKESLTRVGLANSELGINTLVGTRVWDNQSKFRVKLGPLTYEQFINFLPIGNAYKPLTELIRFIAGMEFDFDTQLVMKAREVPGLVLTTRAKRRPRLGWTSWLKTRPFTKDDDQVVLAETDNKQA